MLRSIVHSFVSFIIIMLFYKLFHKLIFITVGFYDLFELLVRIFLGDPYYYNTVTNMRFFWVSSFNSMFSFIWFVFTLIFLKCFYIFGSSVRKINRYLPTKCVNKEFFFVNQFELLFIIILFFIALNSQPC